MTSLSFAADQFDALAAYLRAAEPKEAAAFALAGRSTSGNDIFIREIFPVPSDAYLEQRADRVSIAPTFIAPILARASTQGSSVVLCHSHPFTEWPDFSKEDDEGEERLFPSFFYRTRSDLHAAVVLGRAGFSARIRTRTTSRNIQRLRIVGDKLSILRRAESGSSIAPRLDRSVRAFGDAGQQRLSRLMIGIVGLGGTGSIVAEQLAYLGISRFLLIDDDTIELTNLNRVVTATEEDVGRFKVQVARRRIEQISGAAVVEDVVGSALSNSTGKHLLDCDVIFCCTDTHASRALLNQIAYQYMIPVVDMGTQIDATGGIVRTISGRVQLLSPGLPCLACENTLDPELVRRGFLSEKEQITDPYVRGSVGEAPQPSVVSLNGVVASLAVTMLLSIAAGIPGKARHQLYRVDEGVVRRIGSERNPNCVICSARGVLGAGDLYELPWKPS